MYTYFVSFAYSQNEKVLFGNCTMEVSIKITKQNNFEFLDGMKNHIEKNGNVKDVVILNFILLEEK